MAVRILPGIGLTAGWANRESGWGDAMNANLRLISALAQLVVISRTTSLPGSPTDGDIYLVPSGAGSNPNEIAIRDAGAWVYFAPYAGLRAWVVDAGQTVVYSGSAWAAMGVPASALAGVLAPSKGGTGVANNDASTMTRVGNFGLTLTLTGTTALTLPTSGTLVNRTSIETLTNKTLTAPIINGLMTGLALTQTAVDNTAGRVLKVGDFGLGGGTPTLTAAQLDAIVWTGLCRVGEASGAVGIGSQVLNIYSHSAFSRQIAWVASTGEVMIREQTSGVWGAWNLYSTSSGSNSNGRYVRLPDGTQICYHTITLSYASASIITNTWTFPAAFSANPAISWTASNQPADYTDVSIRDIGAMVTFPSSTGAHCNLYRVSGAAGSWIATSEARLVRMTAIGRWF